jgi:hypothetical protein
VKRVLAEAGGMIAEAEVLAAEPGAAAESAFMSHAAEMRVAAKARMCAERRYPSPPPQRNATNWVKLA